METDVNTENALLSDREMEVIRCLSKGRSEKEIADELFISHKTVRKHIENIKRKLGVSKNTEILAYYVAELREKEFSLKKLREYGIAAFLIFIHVCRLDV